MKRQTEASRRAREQRIREDDAQRLQEVVPELLNMTIEVDETSAISASDDHICHTRRIVVNRAPALFQLPCCDRNCDGSHDLTKTILKALKQGKNSLSGHHQCHGQGRVGDCPFELRYTIHASYAA